MDATKTLNKIMVALGMNQEEATQVNLAEMKLEDGTMVEAETFEAGQSVFVITEDKERMAMPEGSYTLEDGKVMVVDAAGVITDVMESQTEEEAAPKEEAAPVEEVEANDEGEAAPKKVVESETISRETFFAEIEKIKTEFAQQLEAYKEEVANLTSLKEQAELQLSVTEKDLDEVKRKLEEEPASAGMSHSPEGDTTAKPRMKFGNANPRNNTTARVFAKIANIKN